MVNLYPADQPGYVYAVFVAEFTLDPSASTGRFAKYTEGSFTMVAQSDPFLLPVAPATQTVPFNYSWSGEGTITFSTKK